MQRFLLLLALALPAFAQGPTVTLVPNAPLYGFPALQGSVRCLNVAVAGGATNLINWSIPGGGATFLPLGGVGFPGTGSVSIANGLPMQCIRITAAPGTLSLVGTAGQAGTHLSSSSIVTIHAQSVDDPSKTADTPFNIAANTTKAVVMGGYQQVFLGQDVTVVGSVQGNADETGTWSITTKPAGSTPTLSDASSRSVILHANQTGRYLLTWTANANTAQHDSALIFMTPGGPTSFATTPNKTRSLPCAVDPEMTGPDYEIGPGFAYPDFVSLPAANTIAPGSTFRFHNVDTTGTNATTIYNYWQFYKGGTLLQPVFMCGVPDAAGNLPRLDGQDAHGQAGVYSGYQVAAGGAVLSALGNGYAGHKLGAYGTSLGLDYITISGIHVLHARQEYAYFPPGDVTPASVSCPVAPGKPAECTYHTESSGIGIFNGVHVSVLGMDVEDTANGIFTGANGDSGYAAVTFATDLSYNHIHRFGVTNGSLEHSLYHQSFFSRLEGNLIDLPLTAAQSGGTCPNNGAVCVGSCIKWRGVGLVARYNSCPAQVGRTFDGVENQDNVYVDLSRCIDNGNCGAGGEITLDQAAGIQESYYNGDYLLGNLFKGVSGIAIHYRADHDGLMTERGGQLYVGWNTIDGVATLFGVGDAQNGGSHYLDPILHLFNNIIGGAGAVMCDYAFCLIDDQTNVHAGAQPYVPGPATAVTSWFISGGTAVFLGSGGSGLINDANQASGVQLNGFTGAGSACFNGKIVPITFANGAGYGGPTSCPDAGSSSAPINEASAVSTPRILGGYPNGGGSHGWSNQCYYACPWQLTVPVDLHEWGITAANFTPAPTPPYDAHFYPTPAYSGTASPPAGVLGFPLRYQWDDTLSAVVLRASAIVPGANDGGNTPAPAPPPPTPPVIGPRINGIYNGKVN